MIKIICAMDKNGLIGSDNKLPWNLPNDLKYFKEMTNGSKIAMGRKTFSSLPGILQNRIHIVVTRQDFSIRSPFVIVVNSIEAVLNYALEEDVYVIGGGEIYKQFLPYAEYLYVTKINHEFEGDTYFPEYDKDEWQLENKTRGLVDEKNTYEHDFYVYRRVISG